MLQLKADVHRKFIPLRERELLDLIESSRKILKANHPDWTEAQIQAEINKKLFGKV